MTKTKYPSLYITTKPKRQKTVSTYKIPTKTLHDIQSPKTIQVNPFITIFGFSNDNIENVKNELPPVQIINSGKNWISVECNDEIMVNNILRLNKKCINGEIIGVYRCMESVKIETKGKGVISRILEYLFG